VAGWQPPRPATVAGAAAETAVSRGAKQAEQGTAINVLFFISLFLTTVLIFF